MGHRWLVTEGILLLVAAADVLLNSLLFQPAAWLHSELEEVALKSIVMLLDSQEVLPVVSAVKRFVGKAPAISFLDSEVICELPFFSVWL